MLWPRSWQSVIINWSVCWFSDFVTEISFAGQKAPGNFSAGIYNVCDRSDSLAPLDYLSKAVTIDGIFYYVVSSRQNSFCCSRKQSGRGRNIDHRARNFREHFCDR